MTDTATVEDDRNGAPEGVVHSHADRYNEDDFAIVRASQSGDFTDAVMFTVPAANTDRTLRIEYGGPDRVIEVIPNPFATEDDELDPETDDVIWDDQARHWVRRVVDGEAGGSVDRSTAPA